MGEQRSCDGRGGGAQRPVWHVNEPKKTGARTRGQNPLVLDTLHPTSRVILNLMCSYSDAETKPTPDKLARVNQMLVYKRVATRGVKNCQGVCTVYRWLKGEYVFTAFEVQLSLILQYL